MPTKSAKTPARATNQHLAALQQALQAFKAGDFSVRLPMEGEGIVGGIAREFNAVVAIVDSMASEITRVAREVGTEGKLGGQAEVKGVSGTWKDLTDNVNYMASNLTSHLRNIAKVTTAVANGDLTQKITVDTKGELLELKNTVNTMVDQLSSFAAEVTRMAREVGTEGKLGGQAEVKGVSGTWKDLTDNVNYMASNLTSHLRNIAKVTTAVANGDLTQKITVEAKGELLELKNTVNTMVDQLGSFAAEVTRVAREVGSEGRLGGQAQVSGVSGIWKDLTDNVNVMASNLTTQVRGIALVVTAVANGDLDQKLQLEVKGEVATLADTINGMTDTLSTFAEQVTTVAREVGIEGKLGGQARVPGAAGTWKDLTDNVNQLAANLTTQVRAIAEVSTAVTKGDLTRQITVEAQGEVSDLKDNLNQMIANLKETTRKTTEQDWLKTNIARFSGLLQGQKNLETVSRLIMSELPPLVSAHYAAFFLMEKEQGEPILKMIASYALTERKNVGNRFRLGAGLVGQSALEKKTILLTHVPSDYVQIASGIGEAPPLQIIVLPVLFEGEVKALIELGSFQAFSAIHQTLLEQLSESLGVVLNTIAASMRTEDLLGELRRSNVDLESQAKELDEKARQLEFKNQEVELASATLEDRAEQLSLVSKYKSDFLANMSHELRTPLNSLLLLAKLLVENKERTLTASQLEFAKTVYSAGTDLLGLINEILDLSKVEAGKMEVEVAVVPLVEIANGLRSTFMPLAQEKRLASEIVVHPGAPANISTDRQRLEQILRNLLSNAFKFTESGSVNVRIGIADPTAHFRCETLAQASRVVSFAVSDTGIGIPEDIQETIWEAFQQADSSTNRRSGGTGLGLTISRELARLLGGEIQLVSRLGEGSTFTLYLPDVYAGPGPSTERSVLSAPTLRRAEPGPITFAPMHAATPSPQLAAGHTHAPATRLEARPPVPVVALGECITPEAAVDSRPHDRAAIALMVVEDNKPQLAVLEALIADKNMVVEGLQSGEEALKALERQRFDALVLDLKLTGMSGFEFLDQAREQILLEGLPVIIYTAKVLTTKERKRLGRDAVAIIQKGVDSAAQLAETLERVLRPGYLAPGLPGARGPLIQDAGADDPLVGKVVLVVNDDIRNIFALTSVLESYRLKVLFAENAPDGIRVLQEHPEIEFELMDIMMPGMDGYEAIGRIRAIPAFAKLPIIALTAKAMKGDREKCIKAGAHDYVAKPVDAEKLLSVMRKWVRQSHLRTA
jgi:signal transduction histidine kinase/CheY-like chemotaxis protein/HAMP domain-containing protein